MDMQLWCRRSELSTHITCNGLSGQAMMHGGCAVVDTTAAHHHWMMDELRLHA